MTKDGFKKNIRTADTPETMIRFSCRSRFFPVFLLIVALLPVLARATNGSEARLWICIGNAMRASLQQEFEASVQNKAAARANRKLDKKLADVPDHSTLVVTQKKAEDFFHLTRKRWLDAIDDDRFVKIVKKIADGDTNDFSDKDLERVIEIRLSGLKLVEIYRLLNEDHAFPTDLRRFVKQLGYLKDYMKNAKSLDKKGTRLFRDQAKKVLKKLKDTPRRKKDIEIDADSPEEIESFVRQTVAEANAIANETTVPARQYHMARKQIRRVKILFQLYAEYDKDPAAAFLADYLSQLIGDMEQVHDDAVRKSKILRKADYETMPLVFSDDIRDRIRRLGSLLQ